MEDHQQAGIEAVQNLIDGVLKLSTAVLLVPMVFLKFVAEMGPKAHPEALSAIYVMGLTEKIGLFCALALSIGIGLSTKFWLARRILRYPSRPLTERIYWGAGATVFFFLVGMGFLIYLFFQFPIEFIEPFRLGHSRLQ